MNQEDMRKRDFRREACWEATNIMNPNNPHPLLETGL